LGVETLRHLRLEWNPCKTVVRDLEVSALDGFTFQRHDAATYEVVEVEASSFFDGDSSRLVFKHSDVVFILVDVAAILEMAFFVEELFLAKDPHNILQNARLEFLLFKESSDNHSLLERLDI
jgi:hypothetical protein